LGRYDEAIEQFTVVHGPAIAHYNLGYLLEKRGNHQQAAVFFEKATTIDPNFTPARQRYEMLAQRVNQLAVETPNGPAISPHAAPVSNSYESYYRQQAP
jgi:tetratricopeptide (TPR) repeat protein